MDQTQAAETTEFTIHPVTQIGYVSLSVANLENQIEFYRQRLGFQLHWRDGNKAGLGAGGPDLLKLTEVPGARSVRGTTGLYHTAFLFPTRLALAQVIQNIAETRTPVQGGSNHGTHLALYLPDAEGNGIELAWDFPRQVWEPLVEKMRAGKMQELMNVMRQPLDIEGLLAEAQSASTSWVGLPAGTSVGHVHLHVADLNPTKQFYHTLLGFETLMDSEQMGATFFSAGGYHHHIGTNVWSGRGAPPPPADATGLRHFTIELPNQGALDQVLARLEKAGIPANETEDGLLVYDPSQNGVILTVTEN